MLTIHVCKDHGHALGEYLRQADYYSEALRVEGVCFGEMCEVLGVEQGQTISDEQFAALAQNRHAQTGAQLTERMAAERRAGYDAVFSAPKSVSVQTYVGGDLRLLPAHDKAVLVALAELERYACQQTGQGLNKSYVRTGAIAAAVFRHGESRSLDPQLHSHPFIFNVTRDTNGRLIALETADIFERVSFLTEVYRNALAAEVQALGYEIRKTDYGFELAGVSPDLIDRFSKRAKERDAAIAAREKELGRELSKNEVAVLVRENRPRKLVELSPEEVRQRQLSQVTEEELLVLRRLRESASRSVSTDPAPMVDTIELAKEHVFERHAVVADHTLVAEILRASYGEHTLAEARAAVVHGRNGLLVVDGRVSTNEAVDLERAVIAKINRGVGVETALGRMLVAEALSAEQRSAVQKVLGCRDTIQVFRGKAGTGKTTTLSEIIEGCAGVGRETVCFAPSTKAVEVLKLDGAEQKRRGSDSASRALTAAETVQRLFVDPEMQAGIAGKVIVVDEYGLLSTRDLDRLIDVACAQNCRLLLVGDSAQHTSVEASAAARVIERESRIAIAEIHEVHRQAPNREYLRAAKAFANGDIKTAVRQLDEMGAIVEIRDATERRERMVDEWFGAAYRPGARSRKPMTALMVAPTWSEIHELNRVARSRLRAAGALCGEDRTGDSLWRKDWTRAQKKDPRNYELGQVLVARKGTKNFKKGEELVVVGLNGDRVSVRDQRGQEISISPRQSGTAWTVCDRRQISLAKGDEVRLRAVGHIRTPEGRTKRIPNGANLKVYGFDNNGRVRIADGSTLLSREFVHAYATTSHAAQGMTVDAVFMADPISREGLYVSATRGRESIRIFTPNREALLDVARLKSEERTSALEFSRTLPSGLNPVPSMGLHTSLRSHATATVHELRALWAHGVERGRELALACLHHLRPTQAPHQAQSMEQTVTRPTTSGQLEPN
jgi:conjugative relaxase-like TrwC/TraI family protein